MYRDELFASKKKKFYIEKNKKISPKEIQEIRNAVGDKYTDEEIKNIIRTADRLINLIFDIGYHEE